MVSAPPAIRTAALGLLVALLVLALKFVAYRLTGSVALYSDALESVVNVAASAAALAALRVAARPADSDHPFGHSKAEYLSAVLEGVLIVLASLEILRGAWVALQNPGLLESPGIGLAVSAVAALANGVWAARLLREGRRWRSPALVADGRHLFADVVTSAGVLGGVGLAALTGWLVLDPLLAGLVALNVLRSGWGLVRESLGGLLDEAAPPEVVERIRRVVAERGKGALEAHALRTRRAGAATFVELHLVVPSRMTVGEAHDICDRIEAGVRAEVEGSAVTIHVEPEGKAKHQGIVVL